MQMLVLYPQFKLGVLLFEADPRIKLRSFWRHKRDVKLFVHRSHVAQRRVRRRHVCQRTAGPAPRAPRPTSNGAASMVLRDSPRAVMVARAIASRLSFDVFAMVVTVRRTRSVADDVYCE